MRHYMNNIYREMMIWRCSPRRHVKSTFKMVVMIIYANDSWSAFAYKEFSTRRIEDDLSSDM